MNAAAGMARDSLTLLAFRLLTVCCSMLAPLVLLLWLTPADFGYISLVLAVAGGVAVTLDLGISPAHTYLISKDRRDRKAAFLFSLQYLIVAGLICFGASVLSPMRGWIDRAMGDLPDPLLYYAMIGGVLLLALRLYGGIILGMRHMVAYGGMDLLRWGMVLALVALATRLLPATADAAGQVWLLALAMSALIMTFYVIGNTDFFQSVRTGYFLDSMVYGFRGYLAGVAFFLMQRMDYLFVINYHGPAAVAHYSLATLWAETMLYLPAAIGLALFPRAVTLERDQANQRAARAARVTLVYALLVAPALALGALGLTQGLAWLGREEYRAMLLPCWLLLPGVVALSVDVVISNHFQGRRLQHYNTYCALLMVAINLCLNMALIPRYGIAGAAVATSISYLGGSALTFTLFCWLGGISPREALLPRWSDITGVWAALRGRSGDRELG